MTDPTTATLIVSSSYTDCSNCHRQTLPGWATHERITGYGATGEAGCGARFTAITSCYRLTDDLRARLAEMRPDLPIVEHGETR